MKHHCVNLGMAQKCSKYVKTMSTQFYTCLYVTLTYSTRKPVQRKTFRFQNACTMLHKSTDGVKTCLCYLCFISASFLALDKPYHRTHHVIDARLFSSSAPLKAFTKPLNQSCSICNGDLKEFDPWNGALWHCQREHVRGSISWCHQGAYLPSCLRLENLFDAGTKSSSKPHSAHMDVERDRQQFAGYAFILPTAWCESFSILLHWQLAHTKVHIVTLLQCLSEFLQKESGVQQISSGTR